MPIAVAPVFYMDPVNGSDAARAWFSATQVGGAGSDLFDTVSPHGLVAGAVVDFSGFAYSNGAHRVRTVLSATMFQVDGPVYSFSTMGTGTVTPRGGSSWADAWKTPELGATTARLSTGSADLSATVRMAHGGYPTSMGVSRTLTKFSNATVTASTTIDLGAGRGNGVDWIVIDQCAAAMTGANSGTSSTSTTLYQQGAQSTTVSRTASGIAANTKYAYRTLSTLDLSSCDTVTFWVASSIALSATNWRVCLCSDTLGDVVVHSMPIPAISNTSIMFRAVFNNGGPLSSSIQSIAVYSGASALGATITLDNIVAYPSATGLGLDVLVGAIPPAGEPAPRYPLMFAIRSLETGTTLRLLGQQSVNSGVQSGFAGWPCATGSYLLYRCRPAYTQTTLSQLSSVCALRGQGTPFGPVVYEGGYNASTGVVDFYTILLGEGGYGLLNFGDSTLTVTGVGVLSAGTGFRDTRFAIASSVSVSMYVFSGSAFITRETGFSNHVKAAATYVTSSEGAITVASTGGYGNAYLSFHRVIAIPSSDWVSNSVGQRVWVDFDEITPHVTTTRELFSVGEGASIYVNFLRTSSSPAVVNATAGVNQLMLTQFLNTYGGVPARIHIKNTTFPQTAIRTTSPAPGRLAWLFESNAQGGTEDIVRIRGSLILRRQATTRPGGIGFMWTASNTDIIYISDSRTPEGALRLPVARFAISAGATATVRAWVRRTWTDSTSIPYHGIVIDGVENGPLYAAGTAATGTWEQIVATVPAQQYERILEVEYYFFVMTATAGNRSIAIDQVTCEQV